MKGNTNPEPESQFFPVKSLRMAKQQGDDWTVQRWLHGLLSHICLKSSLFLLYNVRYFWWWLCLIMAAASSSCVRSSVPALMGW